MRLIDLSHRIVFPHWRWKPEREITSNPAQGAVFLSSRLNMTLHGFTHVDGASHFLRDGAAVADMPLDRWVGPAAVIDLTHVGADQAIRVEDLERCAAHLQADDIALLRTDWDRRRDISSRQFWTEAPYVSREAALWLADHGVKAVGYDFPADASMKSHPENPGALGREAQTTHDVFFPRGIVVIEYLANLAAIDAASPRSRAFFVALPLKVDGGDGSPVRAVALEL
ncbi:MAG: cyclase family protein [Chloroflexota bacterium]